jgi:hypothetical protein
MFAILIFFIIFIFFCAAFYFSQGTFPEPFRKTAIFKNPKTGQYEQKNIDEKGNIIPEKIETKTKKKELETKINNNIKIDNSKEDLIIAKIIKKEIDSQKYNELTWLEAFKKAKGNKQEAQALYAEYRSDQLEKKYYEKADLGKNNMSSVQYKKIKSGNDKSFFENSNFLSGREDLAVAFWLYVFVGNFLVGLVAGLLTVIIGNFMLVFLLFYLFFSTAGLWKCADSYTVQKQKRRESYGWAIGAKIYVVINLLYLPFQIFQFIGK